jgi:AAA domain
MHEKYGADSPKSKWASTEFARLMEPVARALLGPPNKALSSRTELRWGTRGSMSVDPVEGTWFDHEANEGGGVLGLIEREKRLTGADAFDWMRKEGIISEGDRGKDNGHAKLTAHVYRDAEGVPRFRKVRNAPGRMPRFWLEQPDGNGGWRKGTKHADGTKAVDDTILYRIDEVNEAIALGKPIAVVEGERDADNLWRIGIPATCNAHGASESSKKPKWTEAHSAQLRGADIVVFNDNDEPGYAHADVTCRLSLGVANSVRRLDLKLHWPEMPERNDVSDWLERGVRTREQLDELMAEAPDYAGDASDDTSGFPVVHWQGETDARAAQPWLVAGLLPEVGTGLISGQWGTFKTFAALDLAAAIAWGGSFLDYMVRRQGGTLFVATEGSFQVPIRLQALIEKKSPNGKKIPFAWIDSCPSLLKPSGVKQIVAGAKKIDEQMRAKFGVPLVAIVVDTVVNAAGYSKAGDENDAAIGAALMQALTEIAKQTSTFVFGVDHFGKAIETGTRGSSAKEAGADVVLALLGDKAVNGKVTGTRLAVRKNRAGESGQEFPFTAPVVDMGQDDFGLPITTRIIEWGKEQGAASDKTEDWAGTPLKTLRRALMAVLADAGKEYEPQAGEPAVRAVDLEFVRTDFYKSYYVDGDNQARKQAAKQKAFNRAINSAQARGLIGIDEDDLGRTTIWFAHPEDAKGTWGSGS